MAKKYQNQLKELDENQKKNRVFELLRDRWSKGKPLSYKGKKYFVGKVGGVFGLRSFYLQTEKLYNAPETAHYQLGRDALEIADDDKDIFDWEASKEILLREHKG